MNNILRRTSIALITIIMATYSMHACGKKNKIAEIQYTRTPCYGTCPWYKIVISSDGAMRYEGLKFVKNEGIFEGKIKSTKADEVAQIFDYVNKLKIDTFQDKYNAGVSDLPGKKMLLINSKGKPVKDIFMIGIEPEPLRELSEMIDSLIPEDQIPTMLPLHKPLPPQ